MQKREADSVLDAAIAGLEKKGVFSKVANSLVLPKELRLKIIDQRSVLDTGTLLIAKHNHEEHQKKIGKFIEMAEQMKSIVTDKVDLTEMKRLYAHTGALLDVNNRLYRAISSLDAAAHDGRSLATTAELGAIQGILEDERMHRAALTNAVKSVLVSRPPSQAPPEHQSRSRLTVLLFTSVLKEALGEKDPLHAPQHRLEVSDVNPDCVKDASSILVKAAQDF
jgi:predicted GTPase